MIDGEPERGSSGVDLSGWNFGVDAFVSISVTNLIRSAFDESPPYLWMMAYERDPLSVVLNLPLGGGDNPTWTFDLRELVLDAVRPDLKMAAERPRLVTFAKAVRSLADEVEKLVETVPA